MQRQLSRSSSVSNMDELLDHKEPKDKAGVRVAVKSEKTKLNIAVKKSKPVDIVALLFLERAHYVPVALPCSKPSARDGH